ncbi:protein kinase [Chloroflexales bacterium ZM16-3]|nr:protein kinase [Chloroflexales bacterium ZM16-3]
MSDDLSGRTLGRYHVLERLGRGGMAEVYRAYQPSLDRYVAIKVIYPHLASDPALLERFGREARAVAALHHPNIVQVHDFDAQAGTAFMAMEFISGPTLKAAIQSLHRRGVLLPLPLVGQIIGQLADALGYAHEQRVIHRDVKPANVLIRRRGPADAPLGDAELDALLLGIGPTSVVLTDFGVARIIKDSVEHTAAGTILGSPAYMSPEQGRGERVGAASDIYSLGIVLYELLMGQVPFDADTPFAIVIKHSTAPLPPPRSLRPDLPAPIEQVLLKALAKDPADRFQEAAAFGAALREATGAMAQTSTLSLTPTPAVPAPAPAPGSSRETRVIEMTEMRPTPPPAQVQGAPQQEKLAMPRRRSCLRTALITLGALTVIALITIGAFVAGGALVFRGLGQAGALVVPTELSVQATAAAAEGTVFPISPQPGGPTATVNIGDPVAVAMAEGRAACAGPGCPGGSASGALEIYNQALTQQPDSADLLAARAQLYVWWDVYSYADQARADIAAALDSDDDTAVAYLARGGLIWATAEDDAARGAALDDFNKAIKLDPGLTAAYLERARFLFSYAPDFYDARSASRNQVIADTSEVIAREPTSGDALNLRAEAYYVASLIDAAMADTNAALAINAGDVQALIRRAEMYRYHYDQPDAAMKDFAAAIALDPKNVDARAGHAAMLVSTGNPKAALADADAMIDLAESSDPSATIFHGFIMLTLRRAPEAAQDFARALEARPDDISARYGRGLALLAQNQAAEAIPDLEAAAQSQDALYSLYEVFSHGHPSAGVSLAKAYLAAGRQGEAAPLLNAAVEESPDWYLPYLVRARYRRATGDLSGARADLRSAAANAASAAERAEVEQEQSHQP